MYEALDVRWLLCQNVNYVLVSPFRSNELYGLALSIDPDSDVDMPARGQWVRVTGHFDDAAARQCAGAADMPSSDPVSIVFDCRLQFVPTSVTRDQ